MSFINDIKQRAKQDIKTIILPESNDLRVIKATEQVLKEGYSDIILIGNKEEIKKLAQENNIDISKAKIVDPLKSDKFSEYAEKFYELRKAKGITLIQLNMEDLREVELIIPPVEQQKIFVDFAKKIDKSKVAILKNYSQGGVLSYDNQF